MEKQRREKALVVVVLLVVIAGLTVAFAALSSSLNINGTAYLDAAKWGIRFENLSSPTKIGSATTTGTAKIEESKAAEITDINVSLSTPGDKITYTVDLVNKGTINAKIDNIEKTVLTSEQQRYLTFKVTDKDGYEIKQGDILEKGETKSLTITIEFIKDLTKEDLPKQTSTMSLSYKLNFVQTDEKKDTTSSDVQSELPNGYKKIEYLESTGIQYIDTDISYDKNNSYRFISNCNILQNTDGFSGNGWNAGGIFGIDRDFVSDGINFEKITGRNIKTLYDLVLEKGLNSKTTLNASNENGTAIITRNHENILSYTSLNYPIFAYTERNNGLIYTKELVYDYKIYINNNLVRRLIPCLDSDNKPCMYDTVSKKTFYNSGTGEFLYGNVID